MTAVATKVSIESGKLSRLGRAVHSADAVLYKETQSRDMGLLRTDSLFGVLDIVHQLFPASCVPKSRAGAPSIGSYHFVGAEPLCRFC